MSEEPTNGKAPAPRPAGRKLVASVAVHLYVEGKELSIGTLVAVPPGVCNRMAEALERVAGSLRADASPIILPGLPRP